MNDEFESRIEELARIFPMEDKTPQWKAEILAKARTEARAVQKGRFLPPIWLLFAWAAAWILIGLLEWGAHRLSWEIARVSPSTQPLDSASQNSKLPTSQQLVTLEKHLALYSELP